MHVQLLYTASCKERLQIAIALITGHLGKYQSDAIAQVSQLLYVYMHSTDCVYHPILDT